MKDALAIHRWLLAHQVHHEILRLPRSLSGAEDLPEALGVPSETCVSVAVFEAAYASGAEPVAVVAAVAHPPDPRRVAAAVGAAEVRPAPAFLVNTVTDYAAGLVCPLLLPAELTVLVDRRLAEGLDPDLAVHTATGERATALCLAARDLLALVAGERVELRPGSLAPDR